MDRSVCLHSVCLVLFAMILLSGCAGSSHTQKAPEPARPAEGAVPSRTPLPQDMPADRPLAHAQQKFLGNISQPSTDAADFYRRWNQVTPSNEGKWGSVESARDRMNWGPLDASYRLARQNGLPFKQHTLVWWHQQPDWVDDLPPKEQRAELEEWMDLFFQRYPDADFVDVVNEPLTEPPSYKEAIGGDDDLYGTGWDWVIWTFEKARFYAARHGSDARLLLNEHTILKNPRKRRTYVELIEVLQRRGLIDGVGLQAHFLEPTSADMVAAQLAAVAASGLPVYISEFDIDRRDDQAQKARYAELFPIFWTHPAVRGVTLWGYRQDEMWRPNAYLVRRDGSERPALRWLRAYLRSADPPPPRPARPRAIRDRPDPEQ